jgi:hypothetical protein
MPNARLQNFSAQLEKDLKETAEHLRDFFFTAEFSAVKTLDPLMSWRGTDVGLLGGDDPVHPTEPAYQKMAASVTSILTSMESGARKRARTNSIETAVPDPWPPLNNSRFSRDSGNSGRSGDDLPGVAAADRGGRRGGR